MKLSEEDIKEIVTGATDGLKAQLKERLISNLECDITWKASQVVKSHVEEWVTENVLPEVTAVLSEGKASLVNAGSSSAEEMCKTLSKDMADHLKEKLSKSWDRKKIFEAMFG